MKRLLYLLLVTLVLAGIIHVLIVLLIPGYASRDAWAKLGQVGQPWAFSVVASPGKKSSVLPLVDPSFGVAACRFDLEQAPLLVEAGGNLPFWSVAIFDRRGRNIYSLNDRTAIERKLLLIVVDPIQLAQLRKNPTEEMKNAVLVEANTQKGFVLIRALQADESWQPEVTGFLTGAKCEQYDITPEEEASESN